MWFGKAVQDFNLSIQAQNQGLKLVAEVGNAFYEYVLLFTVRKSVSEASC